MRLDIMIKNKIANFWYYHKFKILVVLSAIILFSLGLNINLDGVSDLEIGYVIEESDVILKNQQLTTNQFESLISKTRKKDARVSFLPLTGSHFEVEFTLGISQIILLDKITLERYINFPFFEPLDDYVTRYNINIKDFPELLTKTKDSEDFHVYALPLKDMKLLLDMGIPEDYYFTIRLPKMSKPDDVLRNQNAHIVLDYILSNMQ